MVLQPVLPQPSSFWLFPVPSDENPVTGTTIQGYCGDSYNVGSAGQYHETEIPPDMLPAATKDLGLIPTCN